MQFSSYTSNNGKANSMYSHTLDEFIEAGSNVTVPTYADWCFIERYNNINFTVKNILSDYLVELKRLSTNVYLNNDELRKYNYKPRLLSADIYGTTDLHYLILLLNGICNVKEFHDINPLKMIQKDDLYSYLTSIMNNERKNILQYNYSRNIG